MVAEVEEKTSRLAGETTGGGEVEVGGDQEIGDVFRVNVASDCFVVASGAGVFHDSAVAGASQRGRKMVESMVGLVEPR